MNYFQNITLYFKNNYILDARAVSLMRIALGFLLLCDVCIRFGDIEAFYSSEGLWPAKYVFTFIGQPGAWSFHTLFDSYWWQVLLFIMHMLLCLALITGFKTQVSTLILLAFSISLSNRNIYILQAGDDLLRLTLLWGFFLNWGSCYTLDSKKKSNIQPPTLFSCLGYLVLVASVYGFSAGLKSGNEWHEQASAIYYALSLNQFRLAGFGEWLYQYPEVMKALTRAVYWLELLIPLLVLIPIKPQVLRTLALIGILMLQIGIGLSLYVGLFFIIAGISSLALLPAGFMNWLDLQFKKNSTTFIPIEPKKNRFVNTAAMVLVFLSLTINLSYFSWFPFQLHPVVNGFSNALGLHQYWGMFSPNVIKTVGWPVFYGIDEQGRQWNLRTNSDYVDFKQPKPFMSIYKNERWRKLNENLLSTNYTFLRAPYCKYILKKWNQNHPEKKIRTLNLYFMSRQNLENYISSEVKKELYCVCNEN